ncbi:hypothetical protein N0V83_007498 [Neocucurbitaria cava]|uniref:Uncharacterized protein n=1 Tax=Neocucurbitaria cava TaxID=798079 RepID=A0A9W9CKG4_9PLEO|nr:hypothetical protein N0V83_007498 [Neocucurbitaria cava]
MTVPNIGNILMVSQVAWKIGRAFSAGRKDAPLEFQDVEAEIGGLAKALKLLAETLHAESEQNLFQSADREIQDGIGTILSSSGHPEASNRGRLRDRAVMEQSAESLEPDTFSLITPELPTPPPNHPELTTSCPSASDVTTGTFIPRAKLQHRSSFLSNGNHEHVKSYVTVSKTSLYPQMQGQARLAGPVPVLFETHPSVGNLPYLQRGKYHYRERQNRGQLVEYSHRISEDDPKDVEMILASEECRIAVVRKRVQDPDTKSMRLITSIWAFSDDGTVRVELKMHDDQMFIPYSSYFSPNKVSITVPCELKFHDVKLGNRPAKIAKTSWVNYVFDTPQAAALFQNELMGRTLLATFRTEKTMRIHEGLGKSFFYAEQMCGLENLRVWEDNDTGAIIALIHFSADFRNGYLAFYINSSVNPIKVKDDGHREVKIKGLRVPIDRGDRAMRKDSVVADGNKGKGKDSETGKKGGKVEKEKVISGAKIEFASDMEKKEFLEMVKEMQRDMIELPDLLGVN